jgi:hypothetical protein
MIRIPSSLELENVKSDTHEHLLTASTWRSRRPLQTIPCQHSTLATMNLTDPRLFRARFYSKLKTWEYGQASFGGREASFG